ncbi:MAG: hypothetical protein HQK75_11405 [Candidatus Magnetomorum sp.]|nr:hypothetical protein [Candidatus Magnetomorum sp.]
MFKKFFGKSKKRHEKKFDASIPRRMYWNNSISSPDKCPECSTSLEAEYHSYLLLTKERNDIVSFVVGNDGGNFCSQCPVVVLDHEIFSEMALTGAVSENAVFMVTGIINLKAIPEDKRHVPIGEDDNPIPLVEFLTNKKKRYPKRRPVGKRNRRKSKKKKKH